VVAEKVGCTVVYAGVCCVVGECVVECIAVAVGCTAVAVGCTAVAVGC
jgi:hypothetical protein